VSGYAASARLQSGSPRFALAGGRVGRAATEMAVDEPLGGWVDRVAPEPAADGPSLADRLGGHLDDLRQAWSGTTFFVFDPDSWR
jgi:hypothetical protein